SWMTPLAIASTTDAYGCVGKTIDARYASSIDGPSTVVGRVTQSQTPGSVMSISARCHVPMSVPIATSDASDAGMSTHRGQRHQRRWNGYGCARPDVYRRPSGHS